MKYWAIIADNLKKAGWSYGYVSAIDSNGRTIWIADAHRDDGKRFVVRAKKLLDCLSETRIRDSHLQNSESIAGARKRKVDKLSPCC